MISYYSGLFQSTHPMRDATVYFFIRRTINAYFNPRIPCGMRLAKGDSSTNATKFQSTHPMRDATGNMQMLGKGNKISIHASHAGCDKNLYTVVFPHLNFNPRIPCGMRLPRQKKSYSSLQFQSTHPMRDATPGVLIVPSFVTVISIHASHAGCDNL